MKIGILTQPLQTNYGGLLQAYALQKTLKAMGHEVWLINRYYNGISALHWTLGRMKKAIQLFIKVLSHNLSFNEAMIEFHANNHRTFSFTNKYINPNSGFLTSDVTLTKFCAKQSFDAYVVGSDQVWRPEYAPNIYNYFLDFVDDCAVKRLAYAASFGTENWLFTSEQTYRCKSLLKKFEYISTREESGVELCSKYLGRDDAQWVLDPTLLLKASDYREIVTDAHLPQIDGNIVVSYLLDENELKHNLLNKVCKSMNAYQYNAKKGFPKKWKSQASVEEWLYGFSKAKYAVVDSFHGCVFSILFHVPFIVVGNKKRGMARFISLLSIFGLENRLVDENFSGDVSSLTEIHWSKVDNILKVKRNESLDFLKRITS